MKSFTILKNLCSINLVSLSFIHEIGKRLIVCVNFIARKNKKFMQYDSSTVYVSYLFSFPNASSHGIRNQDFQKNSS